jgi:hypothetical protein
MSKITLVIIIFLMLVWLFYITQNKNVENMSQIIPKEININKKSIVLSDNLTVPSRNKIYIKHMPSKKCIVKQKSGNISKKEINDGHVEICPKDPISIKQFNKEFFDFRNKIANNSSMILDPVDKITDLFLDGTLWTPPEGEEAKPIAEIYDELTKRPDFSSDCTRLPTFDSVMYDGYMPKQVTGLYSSGNEWVYKNEGEINGGKLEDKLYAHDTNFDATYPLSAFPPIKPTDWAG